MLPSVTALACLFLATFGAEKAPRFVIQNWRSEAGLPQNHITCIARSRSGYLWVGTTVGLARFDGVRFRTFDLHDGLRTGRVHVIFEDSRGTLWIGLGGGGLAKFEQGKFVTLSSDDGLPSDTVTSIAEDHQGRLWVGTNKGLVIWNQGRITQDDGVDRFNGRCINSILVSREGPITVAAFLSGITTFDQGTWTDPIAPERLGLQKTSQALMEDRTGRLWVATDHETVLRHDPTGWKECPVQLEPSLTYVQYISQDSAGFIWCVLPHGELNFFREGSDRAETLKFMEGSPLVTCVVPDPEGGVWVGTQTMGLYRLSPPRVQSFGQSDGLAALSVQTVGEPSPGVLWVGTRGAGLYQLDSGRFRHVIPLKLSPDTTYINVITKSKDGTCWVGMGNGLHQFRDGRRIAGDEFISIFEADSVLAMIEDRREGLWVGTSTGRIWRYLNGKFQRSKIRTNGYAVLSLAQTKDNTVWVGTRGGGLLRYKNNTTERLQGQTKPASEEIGALLVDSDDTLWIGTVGGGLGRLKDGNLNFFTSLDGLPDKTVRQILDDGSQHLWVGTNRGIACLSKQELEGLASGRRTKLYPQVLDLTDGLPSNECSEGPPARLHTGELAFGTLNGLAIVDPAVAFPPDKPPRVLIEEVVVNGQLRDVRQGVSASELNLFPDERRLEFRFTSLQGTSSEKSRFRVRLIGLDQEWLDVGTQRSAVYSYLPAGRYQFEVLACNRVGVWADKPVALLVNVKPYYWETWVFQSCLVIIACLCLVALVRSILRRRYLSQLSEMERQRDLERERARIARDIHDDLGASLTQIGFWSALAADETASTEEIREQASKIQNHSLELLRSLDATVWAINPKNDTVSSLVAYLCQYADEFLADSSVRCRKDIVDELPNAWLSADRRHHLFLAAKEALNNVLKHSNSPTVWLRVKVEPENVLMVMIEDQGRGCDLDIVATQGNGVDNMRRRMSDVGGTCDITSEPGAGTRVTLRLPIETADSR